MVASVTHFVVGEQVLRTIDYLPPGPEVHGSFLAGCILVDLHAFQPIDRRLTHFVGRFEEDGEDMSLTIESLNPDHLPLLFDYWHKIGTGIPYFFPVSQDRWQTCMLEDRLEGDLIFQHLETYLAFDAGRLLGFVQHGQPNFAWNEHGERFPNPAIGVIRHLYFDKGYPQVGQALLAKAEYFLENFPSNHAFYHIMGMSCNAYHGKLHESLAHVEALLIEHGFQVDQENVYYVLDMDNPPLGKRMDNLLTSQWKESDLRIDSSSNSPGLEQYEPYLGGVPAGSAIVRILEPGIRNKANIAYLHWIGLDEDQRGRGLGAVFLSAIIERLRANGYRYLHTDTASTNLSAQRFYDKFGFQNLGKTRSYSRP